MLGNIYGLQMIESTNAVVQDGTRPIEVRRSFKERFFSWPWKPWILTRTIQVPNYKPSMYRIGHQFIYHPSLKSEIYAVMSNKVS